MTELKAARILAFDLDGTLVDSLADLAAAANAMRTHLKLAPLPQKTLESYVGDGIATLTQRALKDAGGDNDEAIREQGLAYFLKYYGEHLTDHTRPYPDVADILALLQKKGFPLAVITNKNALFARGILRQLNLADYFSLVLGGDSLPAKKPDPLPLRHVAEVFAVAPQELVMVGDSLNDIKAANAAGAMAIGVTYGYEPKLEEKCREQKLNTLFLAKKFSDLYPPFARLTPR